MFMLHSRAGTLIHILSPTLVVSDLCVCCFCLDWTTSVLIWRLFFVIAAERCFEKVSFSWPHWKARPAFFKVFPVNSILWKARGAESAGWVWTEGRTERKTIHFQISLHHYAHGHDEERGELYFCAFDGELLVCCPSLSPLSSLPSSSFVLLLLPFVLWDCFIKVVGSKQQLLEAV